MAKPLNILAINLPQEVTDKFIAQGHTVHIYPVQQDPEADLTWYDLILGPTCCRFVLGMEKFLPTIIKGARKVKYPTKDKA